MIEQEWLDKLSDAMRRLDAAKEEMRTCEAEVQTAALRLACPSTGLGASGEPGRTAAPFDAAQGRPGGNGPVRPAAAPPNGEPFQTRITGRHFTMEVPDEPALVELPPIVDHDRVQRFVDQADDERKRLRRERDKKRRDGKKAGPTTAEIKDALHREIVDIEIPRDRMTVVESDEDLRRHLAKIETHAAPAEDPWWKRLDYTPSLVRLSELTSDVDRCLALLLRTNRFWPAELEKMRADGADDVVLEAAIRARGEGGLFPGIQSPEPSYFMDVKKKSIRFWVGTSADGPASFDKRPPDLKGGAILVRVRSIFAIPPPSQPAANSPVELAPAAIAPKLVVAAELAHALKTWNGSVWAELQSLGATNEDIRSALERAWPSSRIFVPPEQSGARSYTIHGGRHPSLWLGAYEGPADKPELWGSALLTAVRETLAIPTPAAVAKRQTAEGMRDEGRGMNKTNSPDPAHPSSLIPHPSKAAAKSPIRYRQAPDDGWNPESLERAAADLEVPVSELIACRGCNAVRESGRAAVCPWCNSKVHGKPVAAALALTVRFVARPEGGWDSATVANAADDLGSSRDMVVECRGCGAIRRAGSSGSCPSCQSREYGPVRYEAAAEGQTRPKRGRKPRAPAIPGALKPE